MYLPHIDGIRAIAVAIVIAYHLDLGMSGGFIGVDVFFVISGFLIGRLAFAPGGAAAFSAAAFLRSRVKRLFPALAAVAALTLTASFFILDAPAYVDLAQSLVAATFFVSNFYYWFQFDYFYPQSSFLPFLHSWSLGVEAQFYLVVAAAASSRQCRAWLAAASPRRMGLLIAGLFLLSLIMSHDRPEAAFFMAPFRAWEFLIGVWLALAWPRVDNALGHRDVLTAVGIGMIFVAAILIDENMAYPGYAAIAPVAAAALLIAAGGGTAPPPSFSVRALLASPPVRYVGRLSYTLYLVHWPIASLYRNYAQPARGGLEFTLTLEEAAVILAATVAVSVVIYHGLEAPARRRWTWRAVSVGAVAGGAAVVVAATAVVAAGGASWRAGGAFPTYLADPGAAPCRIEALPGLPDVANADGEAYCTVGAPWDTAERRYVLMGDSHAGHLQPVFRSAAEGSTVSILFPIHSVVFVDHDAIRRRWRSDPFRSQRDAERNQRMVDFIAAQEVDGVFIASLWSGYGGGVLSPGEAWRGPVPEDALGYMDVGLDRLLAAVTPHAPVRLLADIGFPGKSLLPCVFGQGGVVLRPERPAECAGVPRADAKRRLGPSHEMLKAVAARWERVEFVDLLGAHCRDGVCPTMLDGRLLYRDTHHLRLNLSSDEATYLSRRLDVPALLGL